jgi:hypothetical protein
MSNSESDDAESRKQKLEGLRAKRLDQESAKQVSTGHDGSGSSQGGLRDRLKSALIKRKNTSEEAGTAETTTRGLKEMSADNDNVPRKKAGIKKKRALKKMLMKKMAMKKRGVKKRGRGQSEEKKVDASSTLAEVSKHRGFLEERIKKLQSSLNDRMAELKQVKELEAAKSKEK